MKKINKPESFVYVFHGEGAKFAAAVYKNLDEARYSIERLGLSGLLTKYPLDSTVFEYAVEKDYYSPSEKKEAKYIQRFTSASLEHYHFEDGQPS